MSIALDAELERRIAAKVESGRYGSADEVVSAGLEALDAREEMRKALFEVEPSGEESCDGGLNDLLEKIQAISRSVPDEEWAKLPTDGAREVDHYLYGSPKRNG